MFSATQLRIERAVLEHHRDVAVAWANAVDIAVADVDGAGIERLESRSMRMVDFLEPEGPTSTSSSPSAMSRLRLSTAAVSVPG